MLKSAEITADIVIYGSYMANNDIIFPRQTAGSHLLSTDVKVA